MFEYLKKHTQILIVGPQRSGTTIATKMIAHDLGYFPYLEEHILYNFETLRAMIITNHRENKGGVYQAPNFSAYCHLIPAEPAVVMMVRDVGDILASQERIGWGGPGGLNEQKELELYFRDTGIASEVKYEVWNKYQKKLIKHPYEVQYESLKGHPLWVEKEKRKNFGPRQTEI